MRPASIDSVWPTPISARPSRSAAKPPPAVRSSAPDQREPGRQHERAGQMVGDEQPGGDVGQHPGQAEGAGDGAELPVGETGGDAELGEQRGERADRDRRGRPGDAEEDDQARAGMRLVGVWLAHTCRIRSPAIDDTEENGMPPKGVKSRKRGRQYEKVLKSIKSEGRYKGRQKEVAARIVNKTRRKKGEARPGARGGPARPPEPRDHAPAAATRARAYAAWVPRMPSGSAPGRDGEVIGDELQWHDRHDRRQQLGHGWQRNGLGRERSRSRDRPRPRGPPPSRRSRPPPAPSTARAWAAPGGAINTTRSSGSSAAHPP